MKLPEPKNELVLMQHLCRSHLWPFVLYAFGIQNYMTRHPANQWCVERVHRPLCEWLEWHIKDWLRTRHTRTLPKKLLIVWPRGFGKTTLVTKAAQLWCHLQETDLSSITDSVTVEKSWDFLQSLKTVMAGEDPNAWFSKLYGSWRDPKRPWKQGFLVHAMRQSLAAEAASMVCSGVEKGITGKHPDALFIDDPIVQEKLVEQGGWLDKVNRHMDAMIPAIRQDGLLVGTATRYHDSDWLGKYIRDEGVKTLLGHIPPYLDFDLDEKTGQWDLYFMQARDTEGKSVLPEVWPEEALSAYERKSSMDFQSQMMNDPGTGEHMPLTKEQLDLMWVSPKDVPGNLRISIHCDTAWKSRTSIGRGDYNVIQVWGHAVDGSGSVYYLEGYRNNRWRSEEFLDTLVALIQKVKKERGVKPFAITDERALGGKNDIFEGLVWSHCAAAGVVAPPVFLLNRGQLRKEIRIREAAGYWVNGKVWLVRRAPGVESLVAEMLRIGVSQHDDMADAAADVFCEEVYTPSRVMGSQGDQAPPPRRPYDEYLQMPLHMIDEDGVRELYDHMVEKEEQEAVWVEKWGFG